MHGFYRLGKQLGEAMTANVLVALGVYIFLEFVLIESGYEIRDFTQGIPFNLSRGSRIGDRALIATFIIGCLILSRIATMPSWSNFYTTVVATIGVTAGVIWQISNLKSRGSVNLTDTLHNLVAVPIFIFLILAMIPIFYFYGKAWEKAAAIILLLIWAGTTSLDAFQNRLDQPAWGSVKLPAFY